MKRSWITWPIVGGVILLLTLFAAIQYRWQVQASNAEREIMQKRVEADTRQFAEDFNHEIQAAYFNFQIESDGWENSDWSEFNERYDYWRSKTEFPELIRDIYFVRSGADESMRYDRERRAFVDAEMPPVFAELKKQAEDDKNFKPIDQERFALTMPVHETGHRNVQIRIKPDFKQEDPKMEMPRRFGHLIILLDKDVVVSKILPQLVAKHFPNGEFDVEIRNKNGDSIFRSASEVAVADASETLLTISPDNLFFFSNQNILPRSGRGERHSSMMIDQHVESRTFSQVETNSNSNSDSNSTKTFTFELNTEGPKKRTAVFTGISDGSDSWQLGVEHVSGSVKAFVRSEQNRKLLTGLSIYLLVIGAIIAIAFSAMRSQKYAQRQIDFVSSVSHEFRTPLAVIYSAGENLADGVTNERGQVEKYGSLIKNEGRKLSAMVEQILEFAGARSGNRRYKFAGTNVNELVEHALFENEPSLTADGFEVQRDLGMGIPPIAVDTEALLTAVQNLIQNAAKYSNGDRRINIATYMQNGHVAIEVADHGIGISPADMGKIFEPFYRAKDVVDAQIHGNGLGLSLVKQIAEAHGGTVSAVSEKGAGSRFTIKLPVQ
ncbi:MAG: hypothetical protein DMF62_08835 [Acidobacteria bacterium]|nr:MAG: hypothetical protein DMF62_08835 [Acidobacteriota bacterium]